MPCRPRDDRIPRSYVRSQAQASVMHERLRHPCVCCDTRRQTGTPWPRSPHHGGRCTRGALGSAARLRLRRYAAQAPAEPEHGARRHCRSRSAWARSRRSLRYGTPFSKHPAGFSSRSCLRKSRPPCCWQPTACSAARRHRVILVPLLIATPSMPPLLQPKDRHSTWFSSP
jgi:hypothetical protein